MNESAPLKVGDKITVRLTVKADRDMDFVQIKDDRAACMEPLQAVSGFRWSNGLGYYQATKDASTQFFIDQMRKGTYVIEYQVYVNRTGEYQAGIATVSVCLCYRNSEGIRRISGDGGIEKQDVWN